jgi:lipoate-protein ligase A
MEDEHVKLVRRKSGGGAIFMDLGGSVFTFLAPSDMFSIDRNFDVILGALRRLGVEAVRKGRNDLTVGDRKMSGSAFKHAPDRGVSLHHGTVLVDADMQALQRYLTPDKRKLQAKGISSVGSRVMNLREQFPSLSHDEVCTAFVAEFQHHHAAEELVVEHINENSNFTKDPAFQKYRLELEDHEWRFGRTPEFSHHLDTRIDGIGIFDVHMQVIGGKVHEAVIFSDTLYPDVIDAAVAALRGVEYGVAGVGAAMDILRNDFPEGPPAQVVNALAGWLIGNLMD